MTLYQDRSVLLNAQGTPAYGTWSVSEDGQVKINVKLYFFTVSMAGQLIDDELDMTVNKGRGRTSKWVWKRV